MTLRKGPPTGADWLKQALGGVEPLSDKPNRVPPSRNAPPLRHVAPPKPQRDTREYTTARELTVEDDGETVVGFQDGGDRQHVRRLSGGGVKPHMRLDLHGKTREQAERALDQLLFDAEQRTARCLLIVCGRGLHSGDRGPVLREATIEALSLRHAHSVVAFTSAPAALGGRGAILVWLKRWSSAP